MVLFLLLFVCFALSSCQSNDTNKDIATSNTSGNQHISSNGNNDTKGAVDNEVLTTPDDSITSKVDCERFQFILTRFSQDNYCIEIHPDGLFEIAKQDQVAIGQTPFFKDGKKEAFYLSDDQIARLNNALAEAKKTEETYPRVSFFWTAQIQIDEHKFVFPVDGYPIGFYELLLLLAELSPIDVTNQYGIPIIGPMDMSKEPIIIGSPPANRPLYSMKVALIKTGFSGSELNYRMQLHPDGLLEISLQKGEVSLDSNTPFFGNEYRRAAAYLSDNQVARLNKLLLEVDDFETDYIIGRGDYHVQMQIDVHRFDFASYQEGLDTRLHQIIELLSEFSPIDISSAGDQIFIQPFGPAPRAIISDPPLQKLTCNEIKVMFYPTPNKKNACCMRVNSDGFFEVAQKDITLMGQEPFLDPDRAFSLYLSDKIIKKINGLLLELENFEQLPADTNSGSIKVIMNIDGKEYLFNFDRSSNDPLSQLLYWLDWYSLSGYLDA